MTKKLFRNHMQKKFSEWWEEQLEAVLNTYPEDVAQEWREGRKKIKEDPVLQASLRHFLHYGTPPYKVVDKKPPTE